MNLAEKMCDACADAATTSNDLARNLTCLLAWVAKHNHSSHDNTYFIRECYKVITSCMAQLQHQYDDVSDVVSGLVETDDIESYDDKTVDMWFDHASISDVTTQIIRATGQRTWSAIADKLYIASEQADTGATPTVSE